MEREIQTRLTSGQSINIRKSNIELLRIFSMFLVLMVHYIPFRTTPTNESLGGDFWGTIFNLELRSISFVCVNCFILISGYFGIRWKWKSLLNYLYQVLFWTILAYFIAIIIGYKIFSLKEFIETVITFISSNWFKLSYLGLFLFAPVLESFIEKSSHKTLGYFIIAFYLFSTIFGWILQASPELHEGMTFVSFFGLYFIGAYIRKSNLKILNFHKKYDLLIYIGIGFILVIFSVFFLMSGITSSLYGYLNPLIIIESVYLFLFFKKLDIGVNKTINYIAASAFAVYLFHVNSSLYGLYQQICEQIQSQFAYPFFVALLFMICVYTFAVIVDKIRLWSFNIIYKLKPIK